MDEDRLVTPAADATVRQYLAAYQPDLVIESLEYLGGGSSSTFAVNERLIFRFPKFAGESVMQATALLDRIRRAVTPHQVPRLVDRLPAGNTFPDRVGVYTLLPGIQIAKVNPTPVQKHILAAHLGDFLGKLHGIQDLREVERTTVEALRGSWQRQYEAFRQMDTSALSADERGWLMRLFEEFLADASAMNPPIVLTHGDFGDENVLVPADFGHLNVIDFEDPAFADPVGDFSLWWGDYGDDFFERMLAAYTGVVDLHFRQRMRFYYHRIPLIYFNLSRETGNAQFFQFGLALLRDRMTRFP